jgi:hypothetical protein
MNGRCRLVGAMLAVLWGAAGVFGQDAPGPRKIYTQSTSFRLPVQIAEQDRAELTEIKLYVRMMPGEWSCRESAPPTQSAFSFRAPQDGEYWFSFVSVDKAGKMMPADPAAAPPGLIVMVDTQPPLIEVRPLPATNGHAYLQVKLIDPNPDFSTARAEYESQGKWAALEPMSDMPGIFLVPDAKILQGRLRVAGADKAGNMATRDFDLSPPPPPQAITTVSMPAERPAPLPTLADFSTSAKIVTPLAPLPGSLGAAVPLPESVAPASATVPAPPTPPVIKDMPIVNSRRCKIEFSIESNPADVTQVEVWITPDQGKTWLLKGESRDGRSPVQVEFPGEGAFGYAFVARTAAGSSSPPASGDAPDGMIEIDMTRPVAEFLEMALDATGLTISWVAHDKNLGPEPVALYYSAQAGGPWQPIVGKLPAAGSYHWAAPKGLPSRVFLRLEATDRAGNMARSDTPAPVSLDPSRPRISVRSVTPVDPN